MPTKGNLTKYKQMWNTNSIVRKMHVNYLFMNQILLGVNTEVTNENIAARQQNIDI